MIAEMAPDTIPEREAFDTRSRGPGCDARCTVERVLRPGLFARFELLLHSASAHEEYGRRIGPPAADVVVTGLLRIDLARLEVVARDTPVPLTAQEFRFMRVLARHCGATVEYPEVLAVLCGSNEERGTLGLSNRHMLRVHLARLRIKLGAEGWLIRTVTGLGYRLERLPPGAPSPPRVGPGPLRGRPGVRFAWSREHAACLSCASATVGHAARGLCVTCYSRWRRSQARDDRPRP